MLVACFLKDFSNNSLTEVHFEMQTSCMLESAFEEFFEHIFMKPTFLFFTIKNLLRFQNFCRLSTAHGWGAAQMISQILLLILTLYVKFQYLDFMLDYFTVLCTKSSFLNSHQLLMLRQMCFLLHACFATLNTITGEILPLNIL